MDAIGTADGRTAEIPDGGVELVLPRRIRQIGKGNVHEYKSE